jgi:hypothetical protein
MDIRGIIGILLILFLGITELLLFFIFDYIADILVSKGKIKKNTMGNIHMVGKYKIKILSFLRKLNEVINETEDMQEREKYLRLRRRTIYLVIFEITTFTIFVFYGIILF